MIRRRSIALAIGLAATLAIPLVTPVLASYPGATNGRIAFGQRAADGSSNVFSVMPNGTGLKQLTHGAHNHLCASYSADGQNIAYCSDVSGSSRAACSNSAPRRVLDLPGLFARRLEDRVRQPARHRLE